MEEVFPTRRQGGVSCWRRRMNFLQQEAPPGRRRKIILMEGEEYPDGGGRSFLMKEEQTEENPKQCVIWNLLSMIYNRGFKLCFILSHIISVVTV